MKERPILFSAPMVRAILNGSKTQTRRIVKLKGWHTIEERDDGKPWPWMYDSDRDADYWLPCPHGQPGDRLWVRETWAHGIHAMAAKRDEDGPFVYAATNREHQRLDDRWRPSIHMPRFASRITLEVTGVRVERLQDISEADAVAEGIRISSQARRSDACYGIYECQMPDGKTHFNDSAYDLYRALWEQINGPGSWEANPWVWVVSFKEVAAC